MTRQLELLRPAQIAEEISRCARVWLPLGTIEYHGKHLPVGLDGLQAHGLCLDAAEIAGGLVYPPLWWGIGGGHARYQWTVMMSEATEISSILRHTLARLQDFGVRQAVLFTGHFADEQLAMIAQLADTWNAQNGPLHALALGVNGNTEAPLPPDHAGRFETTLLAAYHPQAVDISLLPPPQPDEAGEDPFGPQRHALSHSLHGIFGADPRGYAPEDTAILRGAMATWLAARAGTI
ncbi:MAG: creatininase family protein [Cypionkella sp.]|uniref:creatininase family protein n=1 Tax=Cypionkella sp. TaxID=2811411 RepID=UPI002AB8485B|nr:creatininase family protein [Cypionkella sp.]MDZ4309908.1 creatininase family protein [Cypionkella sp.]